MITQTRCTALILAVVLGFAALTAHAQDARSQGNGAGESDEMPSKEAIESVPLGDLAGTTETTAAKRIDNPYSGQTQAIAVGEQLYIAMNCEGCHQYGGTGKMGPDLTDTYWRYGGTPVRIYKSIQEGRPQGMPAWGRILPPAQIWQITAYIESLGGSTRAANYQADIQGDKPNENVAPEADAGAQ